MRFEQGESKYLTPPYSLTFRQQFGIDADSFGGSQCLPSPAKNVVLSNRKILITTSGNLVQLGLAQTHPREQLWFSDVVISAFPCFHKRFFPLFSSDGTGPSCTFTSGISACLLINFNLQCRGCPF